MSKIDELAHSFAVRQWGKPVPHTVHEYETMLKEFCKEVMALPLASRLNEEEKERIRKVYYDAENRMAICHYNAYPSACQVMRAIFGADFFKEERK